MRHRKSGVKLNRTSSHRQAMFRNMVTSLLKYDRITTTDAKAKELRRWADHIVTLAKRGDLHARRLAMSIVREKDVVHKIFEIAPERFGAINGGYTRIIKVGRRPGDTAPMTVVELVSSDALKPAKAKKSKSVVAEKKSPATESPSSQAGEEQENAPIESKQTESNIEQGSTTPDPQSGSESVDPEK
jgi:large subunit ribosomal protein L17